MAAAIKPALAHSATPAEIWEQQLTRSESSRGDVKYAATTHNIALIFTHNRAWLDVLARDQRSERVVCLQRPPFHGLENESFPREWTDSDDARASMWLERSSYALFVGPRSPVIRAAVNVVAERNSFDPVCDYIDSLRWDGKKRVDKLCARYFGAPDTRINEVFGSKWMISAVARAKRPGCQVDHVLTLVGPQGKGKSSGLATLTGPEYFGDNLGDLHSKDSQQYLLGPWVVEVAELDAMKRAEVTTVKAFVTRREDRFRSPFEARVATHPRRVVFAATTNEDAFLKDATGNRRWWPVLIGHVDIDALKRDRDQLWAEAAHRFHAGEQWHLTDETLVAEAQQAQEERYQRDAWEGAVLEYIESLAENNRVTSARDVLEGPLKLEISKHGQVEQNRVAAILKRAGWVRTQRRCPTAENPNRREWVYVPAGKEP